MRGAVSEARFTRRPVFASGARGEYNSPREGPLPSCLAEQHPRPSMPRPMPGSPTPPPATGYGTQEVEGSLLDILGHALEKPRRLHSGRLKVVYAPEQVRRRNA